MTDHDEAQQRQTFQASGDAVSVRDVDREDVDGMFAIRMPVSSTAEARDGEAFSRDRLDAFARQIDEGDVGVFLDHGRSGIADSRYSALGKVGYWANSEVADRDGGADLVADAVLMDPAELDGAVGDIREALATLKAQAELGVPLASSVGWSEDTGDRDVPGDADLLEISIVGIPSDPRTTTASAEPATLARAVSAASSDFDVATFVRELSRHGRNTVEVGGEEIDLTPPDAVQTAATVGLAKDDELDPDCGTGAGRESARQIAGDSVTAERIDDIAAYLTSHEEDVSADGPPSDWSDEEWRDCGNLQYALWGGTGTGTGLEWAQSKANQVAEAAGDDVPYPDRSARNLDDPAFAEGDAVMWDWQGEPVHGRVADVGAEFTVDGNTITGEEGEAVYLIHEWDEAVEAFRPENVAKPESSLDDSTMDLPAATEDTMTDENTASGEQSGDTTDEQTRGMEEMMAEMVDMQEEQTSMLREMYENEMDGEDDSDDSDDEDMDENAADSDDADRETVPDGIRELLDAEEPTVDDVRDHIADLREQASEADPETPETTDRAADEDSDDDQTSGFGLAARMED